jgi:hypothetical protein
VIVDLTGKAITEIAAYPAVSAIAGPRVRPELGDQEGPPAVVIEGLTISYAPFGHQLNGPGLQQQLFAAKCIGTTRPQASQLANAVVEAVNQRGPRVDAGGRLVYISLVESGGDVILDPETRWPTATVTFSLVGAQQAVT